MLFQHENSISDVLHNPIDSTHQTLAGSGAAVLNVTVPIGAELAIQLEHLPYPFAIECTGNVLFVDKD
jgi:hypothetical protein